MKTRFKCRLFDRRFGKEIGYHGGEVIEAENRTEARKLLAKSWKLETPREARAHGFVPWRDVRIEWVVE
jgi:hypothetical protein